MSYVVVTPVGPPAPDVPDWKDYVDAADENLQTQIDGMEASDVDTVAGVAPTAGDVPAAGLKTALSLPADTAGDLTVAQAGVVAAQADIDAHEANVSNPHAVTKTQVGLSNVNNTSDASKPVSTATQTAINSVESAKVNRSGDAMTGNLDLQQSSGAPLILRRVTNAVDARRWDDQIDTSGNLSLKAVSDAGVDQSTPLKLYRSGPRVDVAGVGHFSGTGSPEGAVTAPVGSQYVDTANGTVYSKLTGVGNTGWALADGSNRVAKTGDTMTGVLNNFRAANGPTFRQRNDSAGADTRLWENYVNNDGTLDFRAVTDAGTVQATNMRFLRDGRVQINGITYTSGTGSPEGVVAAGVGARYVDTAITNGASVWVKISGSGTTGWRVQRGDTGWRELTGTNLAADWRGTGSIVSVRRFNSTVHWQMNAVPTSTTPPDPASGTIFSFPAGFNIDLSTNNAAGADVVGYAEASSVPSIAVLRQSETVVTVLMAGRLVDGFTVIRGNTIAPSRPPGTTDDIWPTALPGVAG